MRIIRNIGILSITIILFQNTYAQSNLLNANKPSEIGKKTEKQLAVDYDIPLEYGYIDDRDIMWSKRVWEYIDLNEKLNLPLYYPVDTVNVSFDRRSLFDTLLRGIKNGEITDIYDDSYFTSKLSKEEVMGKLSRVDTTEAGKNALNEGATNIDEYINKIDITSYDVEGYKIMGLWYFDKRQGELKYRLLAIAPVAPDVQIMGNDEIESLEERLAIFWVWFLDTRQTLHDMKVFNPKNSSNPISFDHLLNARRFNSIIYKEENIYGDREVSQYVRGNALFQVLESMKIKEDLRDREIDMWNY